MEHFNDAFPIIDVFAGPGGLGEGFSSVVSENGNRKFKIVLSIEKDIFAHQTLMLRHFLRCFPHDQFPNDYYDYLRGKISRDTLYENHPDEYASAHESAKMLTLGKDDPDMIKQMIEDKLDKKRFWVLIGGPPCQAYSLVGRSRMKGSSKFETDERHFLYREYLKLLADHKPPVFVMENVQGLLSSKVSGQLIIHKIMRDLQNPVKALHGSNSDIGYHLYSLSSNASTKTTNEPSMFLVKAEDYGVPQARHRMFIVGVRTNVDIQIDQLRPHKAPTVKDMIGDLPPIRSGLSKGVDDYKNWMKEILDFPWSEIEDSKLSESCDKFKSRLNIPINKKSIDCSQLSYCGSIVKEGIMDTRLDCLVDHDARSHMASDLRRYFFASNFSQIYMKTPKLVDFPKALLPAHDNIELGCSGKMFSDRFRVQLPNSVATTITSHISKDGHYFIHYDPKQCRSLTVREAARLQTFPDNYKFEGTRTAKYHQVGNAVPPYLAKQIGDIIAKVLENMEEHTEMIDIG